MTPYYYSICDNCLSSEVINEDHDIYCDSKNKILKRNQCIRHCLKYTPIKNKKNVFPKIFLE